MEMPNYRVEIFSLVYGRDRPGLVRLVRRPEQASPIEVEKKRRVRLTNRCIPLKQDLQRVSDDA